MDLTNYSNIVKPTLTWPVCEEVRHNHFEITNKEKKKLGNEPLFVDTLKVKLQCEFMFYLWKVRQMTIARCCLSLQKLTVNTSSNPG